MENDRQIEGAGSTAPEGMCSWQVRFQIEQVDIGIFLNGGGGHFLHSEAKSNYCDLMEEDRKMEVLNQ